MTKRVIKDNKLISMFDAVRFITSNKEDLFDAKIVEGLDDYRIIITHGVMGELINIVENDYYGLDKNKFVFLCNNIEIVKMLHSLKLSAYLISEYIFSNEDVYRIYEDIEQYWDCIFPGRESKTHGIFNRKYSVNIYKMYQHSTYPVPAENMPLFFNQSKCGLMTTLSEGSCLSVGEMLLCGIPVISVNAANNLPNESYYPFNKQAYKNTYDVVLPHTLGGRELFLTDSNSIYCDRDDDSIEAAIVKANNKRWNRVSIRRDFISKLYFERLQLVYLLKSLLKDLQFENVDPQEFINLPYGNSSITTHQWQEIWTKL